MAPGWGGGALSHIRATGAASMLAAAVACPAGALAQTDIVSLSAGLREPEAVAARVAPGVVQVIATAYGTTRGSGLLHMQRLVGAGTIVDAGGYILTNAHLVSGAGQVDVVIAGVGTSDDQAAPAPRMVTADIVGVLADLDLAVLRVDVTGLMALRLARTPVRPGDGTLTVAPGGPGGPVVALGVVLATGAPLREDAPVPYLVTDAAESVVGAPVVNEAGEVVGLAAAFVNEPDTHAAATVALPAALLDAVLTQVRSPVPWQRGVIGLSARRVAPPEVDIDVASRRGQLTVAGVTPGLPADRAGIRSGDVIVSVNHQPVDGMALGMLYLALYTLREGQTLHLGVERAGQILEVAPTAVSVRDVLASQ